MKELSECRVLIVDDVKSNVDVLVEALRDEYKLSVALDGQKAIDAALKQPPDLILLDIVMPGINGYEVCRQLRAAEATSGVPIMFLSSLEDVSDKTMGFEVGGNDYLTKPFEVLEVKARVRSLIKAKAYSDAIREAAERELRIANEIQMGLLPTDIGKQTEGTGLDVHGLLEPAQKVGGDLFEVLRLSDDRVLVAVGDVSGKSIPAAIFMAVAMTLLRSLARQGYGPGEILHRMNDELRQQNPRGMFVTLQILLYELNLNRVICASAGHHGAVRLSPGQPPQFVFSSTSRVLGLLPIDAVGIERIELTKGETLVLFTDGVSEAVGLDGDLLGEDRLLAHLAASPGKDAAETTAGVLAAVRHHAAGTKQSDDITVVAVRCAGRS